jgi:hypothetical protein
MASGALAINYGSYLFVEGDGGAGAKGARCQDGAQVEEESHEFSLIAVPRD